MTEEDEPGACQVTDTVLKLLLEATRALLWIETAADGARVAADFVRVLGGAVVPASTAGADVFPVDISFGAGPPVLPWGPPASTTRMHLERYLPVLVEDIRRAVDLLAASPDAVNPPIPSAFVAFSLIEVPAEGAAGLEAAFSSRMGAVDTWPGFNSLEVWADLADPRKYVMVSWWDSPETFEAYMGSPDHRASHQRIPRGPNRPKGRSFARYRLVAR